MEEKTIALVLLGLAGALTLFEFITSGSFGLVSDVAIMLALVFTPLSFIIYKWGYWMIPYVTQGKRVVRTDEAVIEISPTEDAVVRYVNGAYYATVFLVVKIFKTTTSMSDQEKYAFMDLWERAISGLKTVTKYAMLLYLKDMTKYKDAIEMRKAKAQVEIGAERDRENPDPAKIEKLEREISMWDNMVAKLAMGDRPSSILTYVQTTAKGATRDAAVASARQQANEIRSTVGTALNVEMSPLTGEEMKRCFDWTYAVPPGVKEL